MRDRLGWVLLFTMLAAACASVYSLLQDERYSATASVMLGPAANSRLARAERDVVARRTERRLARTGDSAAAETVGSVRFRARGRSGPIEVEATTGNPVRAAVVANTFAEEFVAFRRGSTVVVDRAVPPGSPSSPRPVRDTLIGGFAGLLLGMGVAFVRERLDRRRLREPSDLAEVFGLPVLARVPDSEALGRRFGMGQDLPPFEAEAFETLRANLRSKPEAKVDSVLVTSATEQDGKSTVAFNLAAAAAEGAHDVLLVEAEVRRPVLARALGLPAREGLTSVLAGEASLTDACHEVLLVNNLKGSGVPPTMDVLPAGYRRPKAGGLIESERMLELIQECRRSYSLVVIDGPPAGHASDASALMNDVSAVIVVGRVGKLTGDHATRLRERLDEVDGPAFGVVANFADPAIA